MARRSLFRYNQFVESSGIFLLMVLLSFILITLDRNTSIFHSIREAVKLNVVEMFSLVHTTNTELSHGFSMLRDRKALVHRIDQLEKEQEELATSYNLHVPQLIQENSHLRDLLNLTDLFSYGIVVAEQIRANNTNTKGLLYLNAGTNHKIHVSQPVLSSRGLVGQVQAIFPKYSEILPIIHPNHAFSVRVREKSTRYIAHGTGTQLVIQDLPESDDIRKGDEIISTGIGGIYPKLYPVGVVERIEKQTNRLQQVYIQPNTDFIELRFAVVVYQRLFSLPSPQ